MIERIVTARVYDFLKKPRPGGSSAVLCDRLWPRGVAKAALEGVPWKKEWAPSRELREAFHAGKVPFGTFQSRYRGELEEVRTTILRDLEALRLPDPEAPMVLELLSASSDLDHSHLPTLRDYVAELLSPRPTP